MQERSLSLFLQKSFQTNPSLSALFFIDMRSCLHPSSCRERRETTLDYTMPFWTPLLKGCDKEPNYTIFSEDSLPLTACISLLKKEIPTPPITESSSTHYTIKGERREDIRLRQRKKHLFHSECLVYPRTRKDKGTTFIRIRYSIYLCRFHWL